MKLLVINGPNMNLLGMREPELYGDRTLADLEDRLETHAKACGAELECYQSNHEGALVDRLQQAWRDGVDGIVFNPAAYTHTSVALLDTLKAIRIPTVEVHLTKIEEREDFRRVSLIREAVIATVSGEGFPGYIRAMDILIQYLGENRVKR